MKRRLFAAAALPAAVAIVAGASQATAHPPCRDIDATIYDRIVTEGCPPPTQVCVAGTVRGKHGFDGRTVFVLGSRGQAPSTAPDQRPVNGTLTYTFSDGSTLTASETSIGNVNTSTGSGHAGGTQVLTDGTGRYQGATGFAYLAQRFEDDQFVTEIRGKVCIAGNDPTR